jgi:hypothetical protein
MLRYYERYGAFYAEKDLTIKGKEFFANDNRGDKVWYSKEAMDKSFGQDKWEICDGAFIIIDGNKN